MPYTYEYPRPAVSVDCLVTVKKDNEQFVLLIKRKNEPYKNFWALPGGFLDMNETLEEAAKRELFEETNLKLNALEYVTVLDAVDRDPRGRVISHVFKIDLSEFPKNIIAKDDASEINWFNIKKLPDLAFDHIILLYE